MARSVQEPTEQHAHLHVRREELIRPASGRREFPEREAKRRLLQKESRWAPAAYALFLAAVLMIFGITYTTYAFSRYRGVILPGVRVDRLSLSGLSEKQATNLIDRHVGPFALSPIRLT